jgi:peptidoglycan/LPS O-acetylase OafA/YrhL
MDVKAPRPSITDTAGFHIPSLDGIRGAAALLVFCSHCDLEDIVPGGFGVTVFFFLSGYLITTLLRAEFESAHDISLKRFYLRRFYRIIPPMYLVLCLLLLPWVHGPTHSHVTTGGLIAQFAQFTNYYAIVCGVYAIIPGSGQMWSLSVEEHFYLLFPLCLLLALRRWSYRRIVVGLLCLCALVLVWRCIAILGLGFSNYYTYTASDCRIDSMLFGCMLALWASPGRDPEVVGEKAARWILAAGCVGLALSLVIRNPTFRETFRYSVQGVALIPVFYCAVRYPRWLCFRWLNTRPMIWMGLISYTFYLVHVKCLAIAGRYVERDTLQWALAGFVLAVLLSVAIYFLLEKHMAKLRRQLHPA